jgi:hypothetical protein
MVRRAKELVHGKNYRAHEHFTNLILKGIKVECLENGRKLTIIWAYNFVLKSRSYKEKFLTQLFKRIMILNYTYLSPSLCGNFSNASVKRVCRKTRRLSFDNEVDQCFLHKRRVFILQEATILLYVSD